MLKTFHTFSKGVVLGHLDEKKKLLSYEIKPDNETGYITVSTDLHNLRLALDELDDIVIKGMKEK